MRDRRRRVRVVFVGLILAFPVLMMLAGRRTSTSTVRAAVLPVVAVEAVLIIGLAVVARERRRLLAERAGAAARPEGPVAPAGRVRPAAPVRGAAVGR
jgi:hypothetical protein